MSILETRLYTNLRRVLRTHPTWPACRRILREHFTAMRGGRAHPTISWGGDDLNAAMVWETMPEGSEYWLRMHDLYRRMQRYQARGEVPSPEVMRLDIQPLSEEDRQARIAAHQAAIERQRLAREQQIAERNSRYAKMYD